MLHLTECPRDAMQGWPTFIPTTQKTAYLNALLRVGFDTLDFGSFVSPKAIPQLADTAQVLAGLDLKQSATRLLAIVANLRGAETAARYPQIRYIGFPLSVSETFQQRNTNKSIREALDDVARMQELCARTGQQQVVYLSMGFGNPYGDPWSPEILGEFTQKLDALAVGIVALSDTIGASVPATIAPPFRELTVAFPHIEFGAHLHTTPGTWREKVQAAYEAGCRRFDGALGGYGGCPMATDELTGNMPTERLIEFATEAGEDLQLNMGALAEAQVLNQGIFAAEPLPLAPSPKERGN
ncbi:hydroxymethylglutaryl-CoA lyase [Hymenobacter sp. BT186]|uniref:Hydroxymethylglutaryl-CoA lyase n=1 Tax=Hymenobacter telluris TaxID=2816474 RepID=A0A939EXJ1_9BACT|nr:hydroxymethylglutaryl-CoA lyase [Hymenobacter telluris]MBO0359012.1 hydroxymethylglutaryl-CoA lyase [Hymenobacter telluris]MBW3375038.1 hydroxymethylglutaryl-CoA lyase [Hymenobacter norwichensis]